MQSWPGAGPSTTGRAGQGQGRAGRAGRGSHGPWALCALGLVHGQAGQASAGPLPVGQGRAWQAHAFGPLGLAAELDILPITI